MDYVISESRYKGTIWQPHMTVLHVNFHPRVKLVTLGWGQTYCLSKFMLYRGVL